MLNTVNKEATISIGKLILAVKSFDKYKQDLNNDELQLELVAIFLTDTADLGKLKDESFLENQKAIVWSEIGPELYKEVLDFFPIIVVKHWLKSMGLPQEQIETKIASLNQEIEKKQNLLLSELEKSLNLTPEV